MFRAHAFQEERLGLLTVVQMIRWRVQLYSSVAKGRSTRRYFSRNCTFLVSKKKKLRVRMQGWSSYRETEPRSFFVIGTEHGSPCAEKFSMQSGHWMDSEWRIDRCVCLACRAPSDAPLCLAGVEIRCRDCFNPHLHWTFCWVSLIAPNLLKPSPWAAPLMTQDPALC